MKPLVKIDFVDFWEGFDKTNNFLWNLLSEKFCLEISSKPDFVIFSNYGTSFYYYKCIRIFYSRENERPDFTICDYAITSDFINKKNHYRYPVFGSRYFAKDIPAKDIQSFQEREKFCCMVVSNGKAKKRIEFFDLLSSKYKQVDSGGRFRNNIGYAVDDKLAFVKQYKFIIAFENSSFPGYTTEKLYDALLAGCIPIYWGDPKVSEYFNPKRFLNVSDFKNDSALVGRIAEIDNNPDIASDIVNEPIFKNEEVPYNVNPDNLITFFEAIFSKKEIWIVANSKFYKGLHLIKKRFSFYINRYIKKSEAFR